MVGVRRALIVATDEYSDPKLTSLNAPAQDARVLADVLRDETVGGFGVETVFNRPSHEVELAIAEFFGSGKHGDTLLAHFSCHGVKSPSGELYFATTNTDLSDTFRLKVTGVPSALVREALEESRASLILCLVDCCYSGAFVKLAKAADTVDLTERLGGKGRAVITASTSLQLALDGEEEPSLFTHAVIDGLRTGEADRDLDGLISLDELYSFVHERVTSRNPNQTPVKSFDVQGEVYVARRSTPVTRPAPLEPDLLADAHASATHRRLGAVQGLAAILDETHPGRSLAARLELTRLATQDDSLTVRRDAQQVLDAAAEPAAPAIPDYEPLSTRGGEIDGDRAAKTSGPGTETGTGTGTGTQTGTGTDNGTGTGTETGTGTGTETDNGTGTGTGGGGGGAGGGGGGAQGRWDPATLKRAGLIVVGLVGVLVIGGVAWLVLNDGPVLPDTEMLVHAQDGRGIYGVDTDNGRTRLVLDDPAAEFPTLSEDRRWMVYLTARKENGGVPRLARIDGSDDAPLLDADARQDCPYTTRPAFSPDGERLAANCVNEEGDLFGLAVVDRDGRLVHLLRQDDLEGAPTWTGDGRIIVMRETLGNNKTTLWAVSADLEDQVRLTDGPDDSQPDWSDQGVLFLREDDGASDVAHLESAEPGIVTTITDSGTARWPTWGPGEESAMAWLELELEGEDGNDLMSLWVKPSDDSSPSELDTGYYLAPAWGSR